MHIRKIDLEYIAKNGFNSSSNDQLKHVKVLPYLSVVQATKGHYDISLSNGEMQSTGNGGFFIAGANVSQTIIHNTDKASGTMSARWVFLKIKINNLFYLDDIYSFPTILPEPEKSQMNAVFDKLFTADNTADKYICYYQIVKLLLNVACEKKHSTPTHIDRAITYIKEFYKEKISVEDIAKSVNLSASHFYLVFKRQMGISPIAYLNNYRLSIAADLLSVTDMTVGEIADSIGVNDVSYFNKMFKKLYQSAPTEYRKNYKNSAFKD